MLSPFIELHPVLPAVLLFKKPNEEALKYANLILFINGKADMIQYTVYYTEMSLTQK